ncbi:MAG: zinc-dependent alcohol dehydrogenase [Acidimicrobiales bacterium]|jgi:(R,R)-butanediol dehydrogenase / meso-butanediol dehydrogenase / diacetyl reductase
MRAGLITGKDTFELVELDEPTPSTEEVVLAIQRCGVCGSDVHAYVEGWRLAPGICGHEWVGTVVAAGSDVTNVAEGDLVTGGQAPGCGQCRECRADLSQYCRVAKSHYSGRLAPASGGFAPYMALHAERVISISHEIALDDAAMIEPAAVALHAVRRSRLKFGDIAVVVGAGPIGLLTAQCVRIAGAGLVIVVEPDADRRALALATGAHIAVAPGEPMKEAIDAATAGLRADIAFDCAGIPQTIQQSVDTVRTGGSVCIVGVTSQPATISPMHWMMKEVAVDTSLVFTLDEMRIAAAMIGGGRLQVRPLHQGTVDLDGLAQTIDDLATRSSTAVKVLVDPTAG